jgi:uncharacterized membrane protein YecN with MAPEG domain
MLCMRGATCTHNRICNSWLIIQRIAHRNGMVSLKPARKRRRPFLKLVFFEILFIAILMP